MFPSGGTGVTAGGNVVRVWDLLHRGGRVLAGFSSHQKTITTLTFDGSCGRLLSAGLDRSAINPSSPTNSPALLASYPGCCRGRKDVFSASATAWV